MSRRMRHAIRNGERSPSPGRQGPGSSHGSPSFAAICRREDGTGRRYFTCRTRDQALLHRPYLLEHVNGWGQVTRRERFKAEAGDAA